jgi:hypothetical protein
LARLETDRDDPENRPFRHPDPLARTENNRGAILRALYTVLIGNPRRDENNTKTRFKPWMQLVGSAVEYAAQEDALAFLLSEKDAVLPKCRPEMVSFNQIILRREEVDEETIDLADVLDELAREWPNGFEAADVEKMIRGWPVGGGSGDREPPRYGAERERSGRGQIIKEFLFPDHQQYQPPITAKSIAKRLRRHVGNAVHLGGRTLVLKTASNVSGGPKAAVRYYVHCTTPSSHR